MAGDFDLRYWLELMMIKGVGDDAVRRLLRAFESPKAALRQPYNSLAQVLSPATARRIREGADKEKISAALKWAEAGRHRIITLADGDYPRTLLDLSSPPTLLYAKGDSRLINNLSVAVVGSRSASIAGARNTEILARALSDNGVTIVSGLAEGIDAAAHRGGLAGASSTIAILGTGLTSFIRERIGSSPPPSPKADSCFRNFIWECRPSGRIFRAATAPSADFARLRRRRSRRKKRRINHRRLRIRTRPRSFCRAGLH